MITKYDEAGALTLERTELFLTVTASSTANGFAATNTPFYPMTPTLNWLRNFANSYSQYEIHKLEFTYIPQVPTTQAGAIAMAFYADPLDATPVSMANMLATEQSLFAPVYAGSDGGAYLNRFGGKGNVIGFEIPKHAIEYSNGTPKMFKICTPSTFAAASAQTLYSPGELAVATEGLPANFVPGQVFVRYRIRLCGPISINLQN